MKIFFAGRVRWVALLALLPGKLIFADIPDGVNPLDSLGPAPVQQYVIGDNASSAATANQAPTANPISANSTATDLTTNPVATLPERSEVAIPNAAAPSPVSSDAPAGNPGTPTPMPSDVSSVSVSSSPDPSGTLTATPPVSTMPVPTGATGPQPLAAQPVSNNAFAGGIDTAAFISCGRLATLMCVRATDNMHYQTCLTQLTNPACRQFLAFVAATGFSLKDTIDLIKRYPQAQLDLLHIQRFGMDYPGDYYAVGASGDLINITSGPQAQAIDITKNTAFPQIQRRFPKAQLWSIVQGLPQTAVPPDGQGLRLIFRFSIMNGCPSCELAGYANVAYDFSPQGQLKQVQLLTLDPTG